MLRGLLAIDKSETKSAAYWDTVARRWASQRPQQLWRHFCDLLNGRVFAPWLDECNGGLILKTDLFDEATSGEGLYPLLSADGRSVVGMDLSVATAVRAGYRQAGLAGVGGDVRGLPFADGSFDVVVSNSTLDHMDSLDDVAAALRELYRVLKPGGRLLLTLDNLANPVVALRNSLPERFLAGSGLVPYYVGATCGPGRLASLVNGAGFQIREMDAIMHCPRAPAVLVCAVVDRLKSERLRSFLIRSLFFCERLGRLPTRYLTGYFIALEAKRA